MELTTEPTFLSIWQTKPHIHTRDTKILPSWRLRLGKCHSAEIRPAKNKTPGHSLNRHNIHPPQRGLYAPHEQKEKNIIFTVYSYSNLHGIQLMLRL